MKRLFIHHPLFRLVAPPIHGVLVYLVILLINNNVGQLAELFSNEEVYVCIGLSVLSFEAMRFTVVLLRNQSLPDRRTILITTLATVSVSIVIVIISISMFYKYVIGFDISTRELVVFGVITAFSALLYNALVLGNQYLLGENTVQLEQEHKLRENLESEFTTFRQEINPDLLYDSLEELVLCMHRNTETAEELIDSLAALYRYQLEHRQREFISLDEELKAVHHWLRLINQKHSQHVQWISHISEVHHLLIMPGALITALDCVVRNTLISRESPLILELESDEDGYFVLRHGVNDRLQLHEASREAFQRIQRSYAVYSDRPFIQVKAGRENYIKFPRITVDTHHAA
ncbi:MAG TPA: histidine kinase [Cyclobacteriaceae bacterium]|nr:histidine kinase [Cyclobacteriaceae bacterium]